MAKTGEALRRVRPAAVTVPEGGVRVVESHHAPGFEMEMAPWPFHKICWVAMGRGRLVLEADSEAIERNQFLVLPAGKAHRFLDDRREPLTLVILCISRSFVGAQFRRELATLWSELTSRYPFGTPLCARTGFHLSELVDLFRRAMQESEKRQVGWPLALGNSASTLLMYLGRNYCQPVTERANASMETVAASVEYIRSNLQEPLQIEDMARRCQLSPRRYTDLFKQSTGLTFSRFIRRERIRFACRRMRETRHILYACHESGFNDLAYFYRVFKKEMGQTPGEFLATEERPVVSV